MVGNKWWLIIRLFFFYYGFGGWNLNAKYAGVIPDEKNKHLNMSYNNKPKWVRIFACICIVFLVESIGSIPSKHKIYNYMFYNTAVNKIINIFSAYFYIFCHF